MAIPESQLTKWARPVTADGADQTIQSLSEVPDARKWPGSVSYVPSLYGSRANETHVREDANVNVLLELSTVFVSANSNLAPGEMAQRFLDGTPATYGWRRFRSDVAAAFVGAYGRSRVEERARLIRVKTPWLVAEIVPCVQFRKYQKYQYDLDSDYVSGIAFYVPDKSRWSVNFPRQHWANGIAKDSRTSARFKETVRMFKGACKYLDDRGRMNLRSAPSYFLECVVYNVPDYGFAERRQDTFLNVLGAVVNGSLDRFVCQDEQRPLFGYTPEQWSALGALDLAGRLLDLWGD